MFEGCTFFTVRDLSVETLEGLLHLRDVLGEAYCQAHGLTFTKVNPPEKMRDYVQSYLDGLLDKYSAKITYFPALNG